MHFTTLLTAAAALLSSTASANSKEIFYLMDCTFHMGSPHFYGSKVAYYKDYTKSWNGEKPNKLSVCTQGGLNGGVDWHRGEFSFKFWAKNGEVTGEVNSEVKSWVYDMGENKHNAVSGIAKYNGKAFTCYKAYPKRLIFGIPGTPIGEYCYALYYCR